MDKLRIQLRAVFYREGEQWIAHCLEMDLVGHGPTRKEALALLSDAILTQVRESVERRNTANIFMPADARVFEMYAAGKDTVDGDITIQTQAAPVQGIKMEAREYEGELALT